MCVHVCECGRIHVYGCVCGCIFVYVHAFVCMMCAFMCTCMCVCMQMWFCVICYCMHVHFVPGPYFDVFNLRDLAHKLDEAEKQCLVEGSLSTDHLERVTQVCVRMTVFHNCLSSSPFFVAVDYCSNGNI